MKAIRIIKSRNPVVEIGKTHRRKLTKGFRVLVELADDLNLVFVFKPGFITDFASVPRFFRGIVDNDDPKIIIPAFVHDVNFLSHFLSFKDSNKLFLSMMRLEGMKRFRSRIAYWAVASFVGRRIYWNYGKHKPFQSKGKVKGDYFECWWG